jgi:hypothetical protein
MALTTREAAFVEALYGGARQPDESGGDGGYAAGAGLSVQARRLMKRPHVQAAIAERGPS